MENKTVKNGWGCSCVSGFVRKSNYGTVQKVILAKTKACAFDF